MVPQFRKVASSAPLRRGTFLAYVHAHAKAYPSRDAHRASHSHRGPSRAGQSGRPYALRTLLTADRTHGRDGDARSTAQALIAEFPRTEHALTGLAQEVDLALAADDLLAAQTALATMEADFPDELLTEAARGYFALLVGEDALPARVGSTPMTASAAGLSTSVGRPDLCSTLPIRTLSTPRRLFRLA